MDNLVLAIVIFFIVITLLFILIFVTVGKNTSSNSANPSARDGLVCQSQYTKNDYDRVRAGATIELIPAEDSGDKKPELFMLGLYQRLLDGEVITMFDEHYSSSKTESTKANESITSFEGRTYDLFLKNNEDKVNAYLITYPIKSYSGMAALSQDDDDAKLIPEATIQTSILKYISNASGETSSNIIRSLVGKSLNYVLALAVADSGLVAFNAIKLLSPASNTLLNISAPKCVLAREEDDKPLWNTCVSIGDPYNSVLLASTGHKLVDAGEAITEGNLSCPGDFSKTPYYYKVFNPDPEPTPTPPAPSDS